MLIWEMISFVHQLFDAQVAAQLGFQLLDGHLAGIKLALKLFLGVGGADFVELRIHFGLGGDQRELLGALEQDLFVDHGAQQFEFLELDLILADAIGLIGELPLELFVEVGVGEGAAVHSGCDVGRH
jgi:hypothetical protein